VPAIPSCIQEPLWDQFTALLPTRQSTTRSAATASASPTASSSDKLIQILGLDRRDRRIADHSYSATTLRRRRDEWIALGVADPVPPPDIGRLTIACTAWTWSAWRWTAASPRPCGGQVAGRQTVTLRRGPDRGGLVLLALFSGRHAPRACGEGLAEQGRSAWSPTAQPHWRSGWTLPSWTAGHLLEQPAGPRKGGHPSGRSPPQPTVWGTESFVISYSSANPHGWTTADDQRNASGHAVGRGGRPPWCPLVPSSRPSQGVHLGRLSGRVSEWVSGRRFRSVHPTACRVWKGQENRMSGRWRSARRRLGPDPPTVAGYPRQP
jgi:hypothetical protein